MLGGLPYSVATAPDEIWAEIFSHSILDTNAYIRSNPFLLSGVCRDWRRILVGNPTLWTTIVISLEIPEKCNSGDMDATALERFQVGLAATKLWIQRAAQCPLSIELELSPHSISAMESDLGKELAHIIVENAPRIRILNTLVSSVWFPIFEGVGFPLLETLILEFPEVDRDWDEELLEYDSETYQRDPFDEYHYWDFTASQKLSAVHANAPFDTLCLRLPWNQIQEVELSDMYGNGSELARVWKQVPNLKGFVLYGATKVGHTAADPHGSQDVALSQLFSTKKPPLPKALTLGLVPPRFIEDVLRLLADFRAPLTALSLIPRDDYFDWDEYSDQDPSIFFNFMPIIKTFAKTLSTLDLDLYPYWDCQQTIQLLSELPGLKDLAISCGQVSIPAGSEPWPDTDDLEPLVGFMATPGTLPRLTKLVIQHDYLGCYGRVPVSLSRHSFMRLLRYRRHCGQSAASESTDSVVSAAGNCVKIESIHFQVQKDLGVEWCQEDSETFVAELKEMVEDGLKLMIVHRKVEGMMGIMGIFNPWSDDL